MRKLVYSITLAALMTAPLQAADWQGQGDMRPGAFAGARVHLPLGGKTAAKPRAALTLAPTISRISTNGIVRTTVGEGVALNFGPQSKPTLSLAGVRADVALGFKRQDEVDADRKLGVSTAGWIAIGAGVALVVGAALFYSAMTSCEEHDDEC